MSLSSRLDPDDHNRDSAGMHYVYPVVSRRAGGVSVGINLNPNNACNWRCIYCQVPGLTRGSAPAIDLELLERELRQMLTEILHGRFLQDRVAEAARHLEDIAFSGNGEPTSAHAFPQAVAVAERIMRDFDLPGQIKLRLITNGSLMDRPEVQEAVRHMARSNGEVWFKVDAATREGMARINDVRLSPEGVIERLRDCARLCPTWVQTCLFTLDGTPPGMQDIDAYLALLKDAAPHLRGVHLYGLARPSMQPEAPRLGRLPADWLKNLAVRIRAMGLDARVSP